MFIKLLSKKPETLGANFIVRFIDTDKLDQLKIAKPEKELIQRKIKDEQNIITIYDGNNIAWYLVKNTSNNLEKYRCLGADLAKLAQGEKATELNIDASILSDVEALAFSEGFVLAGYRFLKYLKKESKEKKEFTIKQVNLYNTTISEAQVLFLNNTIKAVFWARDMVNEPVNFMNAVRFSNEVTLHGQEAGFMVEVLDKKKISALRMGGLLSVNKGSIDPPTFTICEWKPKNAVNKKPYVLVGKGVMYDTGGLSLKPTSSMDTMKSDMSGAAAVAASIYAMALNKQTVWVIGLLPATDNRPDGNAYTPGDIIKMYNGLTVEVLNTDAEGRLILADGLSYGDKYEPELICTMATLTGNASLAVGQYASVFMGNANADYFTKFSAAGEQVYERLVQFPFFDEYGESLKTNVADLKNIGAREGGAISAGKFLEHFTKSPYIHFDIAGSAFISADNTYTPKGGTGIGVRLFTEFFKNISDTANKK